MVISNASARDAVAPTGPLTRSGVFAMVGVAVLDPALRFTPFLDPVSIYVPSGLIRGASTRGLVLGRERSGDGLPRVSPRVSTVKPWAKRDGGCDASFSDCPGLDPGSPTTLPDSIARDPGSSPGRSEAWDGG